MIPALVFALLACADPPGDSAPRPTPDPAPSAGRSARSPAGTVLLVVDPLTLVVRIDDKATRVRLLGVAPMDHLGADAYRAAASRELQSLLEGHAVSLEYEGTPARDSDGRLPAYVRRDDGLLLDAELVGRGYGRAAPGRRLRHRDLLDAREAAAWAGRLGLWATEEAESQDRAAARARQRKEEQRREEEVRRSLEMARRWAARQQTLAARAEALERAHREREAAGECKYCGHAGCKERHEER
jgi:endonuclease YncB( thermonuclease family)